MIWRILFHRLRKHAMLHLVAPLVIGLIVESFIEGLITIPSYRLTSLPSWLGFYSTYSVLRTVLLFAGVFGTYIAIMIYVINKETGFRTDFKHLAMLKKTLDGARSFFGISVMPIEEWFEPSMQVYLAKLFNRKLERDDFEHERTLLFFSDGELNRTTLPLMDEHYHGRCLAYMHRDCGIPLSYIGRKDVFKILNQMPPEDKVVLCYPHWTGWGPFRVFRWIPPHWLRRRIKNLDIAVVELKNGKRLVLRVSKHGTEVPIKKMSDEEAKPYLKFLDLIREEIYEDGTKQLKDDYDFVNIYHAHFGLSQVHTSVPPPPLGTKPPGASSNGHDEPSAQVEGDASAHVGSEALEESHAGAAEEESAYHAVTILPPDSTAGVEPPKPNKKSSRRTRAHPAPPST